LYLTIATGPSLHAAQGTSAESDPDALYADRANLASAARAADLWTAQMKAHPADFEAAWKLARARYWLGRHLPSEEQKRAYEDGMAAARQAIAAQPGKPEGHFWMAANMGALAESFGLRQGIKYRGAIRDELETVLKLDPAFQQGSADRALGRWYYKVPGLFGGSNKKSEEYLRKALAFNPNSIITLLFLGETLIDMNRKAEAKDLLQKAIAVPADPNWLPEDTEFKQRARELLVQLKAVR
jgi:tetratricopeptide (TPR) repeat protein